MVVLVGLMKATGPKQWSFDREHEISLEQHEQLQMDQASLTNFVNGDLCPYVQFSHQNYLDLFSRVTAEARNISEYMPNRGTFGSLAWLSVTVFSRSQPPFACIRSKQTQRSFGFDAIDGWGAEFAKTKKPLGSIYYDRFFGYRFCARLRTFLLHESADLIHSEITRSLGDQGPQLTVFAYRDDLVDTRERRKHWSAVAPEIDQLDEKIDLTPLITEATEAAVRNQSDPSLTCGVSVLVSGL